MRDYESTGLAQDGNARDTRGLNLRTTSIPNGNAVGFSAWACGFGPDRFYLASTCTFCANAFFVLDVYSAVQAFLKSKKYACSWGFVHSSRNTAAHNNSSQERHPKKVRHFF